MQVTPYAGVWIEIGYTEQGCGWIYVTPYAGVWIEIVVLLNRFDALMSLPTRECGLKFFIKLQLCLSCLVTPYAGVWIEIAIY